MNPSRVLLIAIVVYVLLTVALGVRARNVGALHGAVTSFSERRGTSVKRAAGPAFTQ